MRCVRCSGPVASCVISTTAISGVCNCASMVQVSAMGEGYAALGPARNDEGLRAEVRGVPNWQDTREDIVGIQETRPVVVGREALFRPFAVKTLELRNRIVMSPMGQANAKDGVPDDGYPA